MSNSSQGITFGKKIGMIEDTVIQQQSFISKILQTIQSFLQNDTNNQSNKDLAEQFNEIVNDFQQQQENFNLNTANDFQLYSNIDSNNQKINEHQNKLEDIDSELKAVKYLLNNLKEGAPSEDDYEKYKKEISEIENNRIKNQIDPLSTSVKCLKYEVKKMKDKYSNLQLLNNASETSNDYSELNHEMESMKFELKKLKEAMGINNNVTDRNADNQSIIQSDDSVVTKIYSDLYKVRDDLKEEIKPLLSEEIQTFPRKLKDFKRELKQLKKIQEDIEKTNSDLLERQEKIFRKLKKLRDEKVNPLGEKVDKLQSSFDSFEGKDSENERQEILLQREELKGKIDELAAQLNILKENKVEEGAITRARKDLQNLKDVVDVDIPENSTNSNGEDSYEVKSNDLASRIQEIENRLSDFDSATSNILQNKSQADQELINKIAQEQNDLHRSIKCLKFEIKKLKAINDDKETKVTPKERGIDLANNDDETNTKRLDKLEDEIQELQNTLSKQRKDEIQTLKDDFNTQIEEEIQGLKDALSSQKQDDQNSKIDSIESNLSDIKKELDTTIPEQFNQYKEKLLSLETSMLSCLEALNNEKAQMAEKNAQDNIVWPNVQVPAEKHEVNPLIPILKEKIHALVDEMNQAPEDAEDKRIHSMKHSMVDTQEDLKKLQETMNTLLIQDEFQTVKLNPQLIWDHVSVLESKVVELESRLPAIKSRDINLNQEEEEEEEEKGHHYSSRKTHDLLNEIQIIKEKGTSIATTQDIDLLNEKVSELYGSQHQAINVLNSQSSQIQNHTSTLNDQLSRIEDLESSVQKLGFKDNDQDHEEIDNLTYELNELRQTLLSIQEENGRLKEKLETLEEHSYSYLGPTTTSKSEPNPIVVMLEAQVTELLNQIESPSLKEEPDETGELHPSMEQAEQDLIVVQKTLRDLLAKEQADAKHETARALNVINKHTQNRINHLEKIIGKQNQTYKDIQDYHRDMELIKFRLNELSNSQKQVISVVNNQNNQIDTTKQLLSRDVIPQLDDIHSQFDDHLNDHTLLGTQIPSSAKDSVIRHTPNPVVESLRKQINNLLEQIENPDVKSTCENEDNENLKPNIEQLQKNLIVLQDTLQKILNQQIYIPAEETLRGFQTQIDLLQDKYTTQTLQINELKRNSNMALERRISELEEKINSVKKQNLENFSNSLYGEEISKLDNELKQLRKEFNEALGRPGVVSRGAIEQPVMKATPEGHFIIKKTIYLNGTSNQNVEKLKGQIDRLNAEISKAERSDEEDIDDIDVDLHNHLGKTNEDLLKLREQLQRLLDGYEIEEVVPISPQQMYDNINNLLQRVDALERNGPIERNIPQSQIVSRDINIQNDGEIVEKVQQLLSSQSLSTQTINAHTSYIHQMKETIDEELDRISDLEASLKAIRGQQVGGSFNDFNESLDELRDEVQRMKAQLDEVIGEDDYDVIEIDGDDADIQVELEDDNGNRRQGENGEHVSKIKRLENRITKLESLLGVQTRGGVNVDEESNPLVNDIQYQIDSLITNMHVLNNQQKQNKELNSRISDTQNELVLLQATLKLHDLENRGPVPVKAIQSRGISLDNNSDLNGKVSELENKLNDSNSIIEQLKQQIDELNKEVQNQPEQILSTLQLQWSKSKKGEAAHKHAKGKNSNINPAIREIQEQIDQLVNKINDPLMEDESNENGELKPEIEEAQNELNLLRESLKNLAIEDSNEEESEPINDDSMYASPTIVLSRLIKIEKQMAKNKEIENDVRSLKLIQSQTADLNQLRERTEQLTDSQNTVIHAMNAMKSYITGHHDQEHENQLHELDERVTLLENQPAFPVASSYSMSQSATGYGTSSPRTIREIHKPRNVNPIIREVQDQIDTLIRKMNDPSLEKEKEKGELSPRMDKTQAQLNRLRATLRRLQEMEDVQIIEDDAIDRAEDDSFFNAKGNFLSKQLLVENLSYLNERVNSVLIPSVRCVKHELKKLKENGLSNMKTRGIDLELENEERDEKINTIIQRVNEITSSQNQVVLMLNQHKEMIDSTNEKIETVTESLENHLENGPEREITQRLADIEEFQSGGGEEIKNRLDDLENRFALIEDGQINSPDQMWSQSVILRSGKKKPTNPLIESLKRKIDELVKEMNDPSIQEPNNDPDAEQLKPDINKAERKLRALQQTLAALLEAEGEQTEEEIITPGSLYQMVRDIQDKVSSMEENNPSTILSRSLQLGSPTKKKKTSRRKYNNPEMEILKGQIDDLVQHMNDPQIDSGNTSPTSPKLKPSFAKAENELQVLRNTLNALIEETEEETEYEERSAPFTAETLNDFLINLHDESGQHNESIKELRTMVRCLKYEMKKLKEGKNTTRGASGNNHPATEEELMSYCDRLENIAEGFDRHIVEAKKELKRYREIKSQIKKENEITNSLQNSIRCLKHEVKLLKQNRSSHPRSNGNHNNDDFGDDNNFGHNNNNDDNNKDGGDGPNKRSKSSRKNPAVNGRNNTRKSTQSSANPNNNLEDRVGVVELSLEKTIQSLNAQRSNFSDIRSSMHQLESKLNDHDQRIEELEINQNQIDLDNMNDLPINRSINDLPINSNTNDLPLNDEINELKETIKAMETRINELTSSQGSVVNCYNAQNRCILQMKDQIEEILSKQDERDEIPANILNRNITLTAANEDTQESIDNLDNEMNELKEKVNEMENLLNEVRGSQAKLVKNENAQVENIRQIREKLNDLATKQEAREEQEEQQEIIVTTRDAPVYSEENDNKIKCLKYEMKKLKENMKNMNDELNELKTSQELASKESESQDFETQINELRGSLSKVITNSNSQTSAIRQIKEILNDIASRTGQLENKEAEEETLNAEKKEVSLDDESMKDIKCMKYETKRIKANMKSIDDQINQFLSTQKIITDNVNSQISHIRQIHEKLNKIIEKQNEMDSKIENQEDFQEREITLPSSEIQERIDEISSAQTAVVNTLNAQRSQIDQIKEKLNESMSNQSQLMESTEALLEEQNTSKNDYMPNEQLIRIEKELTELQKNHLYLRSQFSDHLKEKQNLDSVIQPINESINKLREKSSSQSSIINQLERNIDELLANSRKKKEPTYDDSQLRKEINSLNDRLLNQLDDSKVQSELQSLKEHLNQLSASQVQLIHTINGQSTHIRKQEAEIKKLKQELQSVQHEPRLTGEDVELMQQEIERLKDFEESTYKEIEELKAEVQEKTSPVLDRNIDLVDNDENHEITDSQTKLDIKCIKYELKKLLAMQSNDKLENEIKKLRTKINNMDEFNSQLAPHINQLEESFEYIQKIKEKIRKLNENDQKIVQHVEKQKQEIKQFSEFMNFSPLLISNGNKQHKKNLKSFFECVADLLNNHSSLLVELDQRVSNQENQSQISFSQSQKGRQTPKSRENDNYTGYVSTTEFQKYKAQHRSQIEQLEKKFASSSSSPNNNEINDEQLSAIKKEIDSLKLTEIRKDIDTLKCISNNGTQQKSERNLIDQPESQKVDLLLSRIDKLEEQLANKTAEIDSKNSEIDELKKFTNKVARTVKNQEEKIKNIRETLNNNK